MNIIHIIRLLAQSRVQKKNRCRIVNGWCVQHVGQQWCMTHNHVWKRGELPCQGRAVSQ